MVHRRIKEIELLGNHPVLDFINSIHHRYAKESDDYLLTFEELVDWHERTGMVDTETAEVLREQCAGYPGKVAAAYETAIELRELLHDIFITIIHGKKPGTQQLSKLNSMLNRLRPCCLLAAGDHSLEWRWHIDPKQPESLLGPLVESAAALLTSNKLDRIKECPPPHGCGWLFLDTSRNGKRNWCSMKNCGNLAKVRRHRQSEKKKETGLRAL